MYSCTPVYCFDNLIFVIIFGDLSALFIPIDIKIFPTIIIFLFYSRGRNVYVQFSSHQELTTVDQSQGRGDEVGIFLVHILELKSACLIFFISFKAERMRYFLPTSLFCYLRLFHFSVFSVLNCYFVVFFFSISYTSLFILLSISSLSLCCPAVGNSLDAQPNRILLVTIHHMLYPMTVDVLYQVFSPHGSVEKIVTFQKSAGQNLLDFSLSLLSFPIIVFFCAFGL